METPIGRQRLLHVLLGLLALVALLGFLLLVDGVLADIADALG